MTWHRIARTLAVGAVAAALAAPLASALAQPVPPMTPASPVPQTAEFAQMRAKFEGLTPAEYRAMGYEVEPVCVVAADAGLPANLGAMGYHAVNKRLWQRQFNSRQLDPQNPPILLIDARGAVVGFEWEAKATGEPAPKVFGQEAILLPGHPGEPEVQVPHHMLHAYFRSGGQVLFDVFDPQLTCGAMDPAAARAAGMPPAPPAGAVAPAPPGQPPAQTQMPTARALPRTGDAAAPGGWLALGALGLIGAGIALARRR